MEAVRTESLEREFDLAMAGYGGPLDDNAEWHIYEHLKREVIRKLPIPEQEQAIQRLKQYLEI